MKEPNPWLPQSFNLTEQGRLLRADPIKAHRLARKAGHPLAAAAPSPIIEDHRKPPPKPEGHGRGIVVKRMDEDGRVISISELVRYDYD